MINSRDIKDLHPKVYMMARNFIATCQAAGTDVIITSTYRDYECQQKLYDQGRTPTSIARGEKKVTNAKPGQSWHNHKCAFDFVPIVNGKPVWDTKSQLWAKCGEIAESCGLEWAGRWRTFKEFPHCQYTGGLTLADLQSGKTFT